MAIDVKHDSDVAIIQWSQRDLEKLVPALRGVLDDGNRMVLLDMRRIEYLKGDGFETLTEVLTLAERAGGVIGMCNVKRSLSILIEQIGLQSEFPPVLGKRRDALERIKELRDDRAEPARDGPEPELDIAFEDDGSASASAERGAPATRSKSKGKDSGKSKAKRSKEVTDPERRTFEIELDFRGDDSGIQPPPPGFADEATQVLREVEIDDEIVDDDDAAPPAAAKAATAKPKAKAKATAFSMHDTHVDDESDDEADAAPAARGGSAIGPQSDALDDALAVGFEDGEYGPTLAQTDPEAVAAHRPLEDTSDPELVIEESSDGGGIISAALDDALAVDFGDGYYEKQKPAPAKAAAASSDDDDEDIDLDDLGVDTPGIAATAAASAKGGGTELDFEAAPGAPLSDTRAMPTLLASGVLSADTDVIEIDHEEIERRRVAALEKTSKTAVIAEVDGRAFGEQSADDLLGVDFSDVDRPAAKAPAAAAVDEPTEDDAFAAVLTLDSIEDPSQRAAARAAGGATAEAKADAAAATAAKWARQPAEDLLGVDFDDAPARPPATVAEVRVPGAVGQIDLEQAAADAARRPRVRIDAEVAGPVDPGASTQVIDTRNADLGAIDDDEDDPRPGGKTTVLEAFDPSRLESETGPGVGPGRPGSSSGATAAPVRPWPERTPPPPTPPPARVPAQPPAAADAGADAEARRFAKETEDEDTLIISAEKAAAAEQDLAGAGSPARFNQEETHAEGTPPPLASVAPPAAPPFVGEDDSDEESMILQAGDLMAEIYSAVDGADRSGSDDTEVSEPPMAPSAPPRAADSSAATQRIPPRQAKAAAAKVGASSTQRLPAPPRPVGPPPTPKDLGAARNFLARWRFSDEAQLRILEYLVKLLPRVNVHTVRDVELGTGLPTAAVKEGLDELAGAGLLKMQRAHTMFQRDTYRFEIDQPTLAQAQATVTVFRSPAGRDQVTKWLSERR